VRKAGAYPRVEQLNFTSLGYASGLSYKHWIRLEKPALDKHSSLLQKYVNFADKKFSIITLPCLTEKKRFYTIDFLVVASTHSKAVEMMSYLEVDPGKS
jgi:hypothetical protein